MRPPTVPSAVYDDDYFLEVCAGSTEWRRSRGTEIPGLYEGLVRAAGVAANDMLVDIGTGRGELLVAAIRAGADHAIGIEYSPAALELARATLRTHGVRDRAQVVVADARAVPLLASSADVVTLCDVIEHLTPDELSAALVEVRRLLRPGGRVFIHTFPTRTIYNTTYRTLRLLSGRWRHWPRDPRCDYERLMHVNEQTSRSLRRTLRRAGFEAVDVRLGEWVHVDFLPSPRARNIYRRLAAHRFTRRLAVANLFAIAYRPADDH